MPPKLVGFKFKLRGTEWTVRFNPSEDFKQRLCGITHRDTNIIEICPHMSHSAIILTLWHEVFHAISAPCDGSSTDLESSSIDVETAANLVGEAMIELLPQTKKWPAWTRKGR